VLTVLLKEQSDLSSRVHFTANASSALLRSLRHAPAAAQSVSHVGTRSIL